MEEQTKSNKNILLIGGAFAVLALIAGVALVGNTINNPQSSQATQEPVALSDLTDSDNSEVAGITASGENESSPEAETQNQVRTISVEGGSFYYTPNEIRVKKGEKVTIVMTSKDMMHDFVIDELDVKMPIVRSGNTGEVTFTADTEGSFEYYCSVGAHRQQGQVGTLIVE